MKSYVVAISGASGAIYGIRLIEELLKTVDTVHICVSGTAFSIIKAETGIDWPGKSDSETEKNIRKHYASKKIQYYAETNLSAPIASGSFITDGMFIVPCSMKTLSGVAGGYADNLIVRAADVAIKEGRSLIISPREMPFNAIHLENMLKLSRLGVKIAPPVPAFYQKPKDLNDMVDFVVGKILDAGGIKHSLFKRWE